MLVHSGAAIHGHEFANEQTDKFWMNPLSFLPNLLSSDLIRQLHAAFPASDEDVTPPSRSASVKETGHGRRASFTARRHTTSDLANAVKLQEPLSDAASISGSERTDGSVRLARRKRKTRSSVRYALAFPAPGLRTKQRNFFQVRPRVLLQLRELAGNKRAIPAFDVIPSSLVAGTLIIPALLKAFPRMFSAKPHLGQNDFLLVRRDDYVPAHGNQQHDANSNGDSSNASDYTEVLAVITTTEDDDCAKIVFKDGSTWVTSRNAGSYEFNHINEQGETVKAKWIKKPSLSPRTSWGSASSAFDASNSPPSSPTTPTPDGKWTFCILDPSTKKHPIQGVLDSTSLEIYNTYATLPASSGQLPSIAQAIEAEVTGISEDGTSLAEERSSMEVSEYNKTLMLATATWIRLRQSGWPASVTPKASRAVSQCINSGRSQAESPEGANLGSSGSQVSLTDGLNSPEDTSTSTQAPATSRLRRAFSSGSDFMKRRREAAAAAAALALIAEGKTDDKHADNLKVREEAATCRTRVKRLAHKVFHHSSTQRVS
ncbi:uncharacterized protein TRIREDRAFT_123675 [Trichoderma reesei QM6a]|jgi:hypothetical protein|uniref:Predicted protein n=2 Tax=Hypocrea jecorina TaxID=51453 RepID=G0RU55_HYPJQ|nr:uncharacterized protein TRIREDRAFT_123675 [Trichoderma reesei QM6a]EGR45260.1 predicted protein [Trichoderma reesei QM6a]ETR98107.1 hypothetical protein M419DRAFT_26579 [Trichoderma reesei RUT C-30]